MKSKGKSGRRSLPLKTGLGGELAIKLGKVEPPPVKLPWASADIDASSAAELNTKAMEAIHELIARAFHLSVDRWTKSPPAELERVLSEERAEEDRRMRKCIQEGLASTNRRKRKGAEKVRDQMMAMEQREAQRALWELAGIGYAVTSWLERLVVERIELVQPVAQQFPLWPFLLGLSKQKLGGRRDLLRAKIAKGHLQRLQLGVEHYQPGESSPAAEARLLSPFRVAAEQVYEILRSIRTQPELYLRRREPPAGHTVDPQGRRTPFAPATTWTKQLFALREPMDLKNWPDWWALAKFLLVEQWENNRACFSVLIEASGRAELLRPPTNKPSQVKSFIIDQRLKNEFRTLALPPKR